MSFSRWGLDTKIWRPKRIRKDRAGKWRRFLLGLNGSTLFQLPAAKTTSLFLTSPVIPDRQLLFVLQRPARV
jgi:hypothetical protein